MQNFKDKFALLSIKNKILLALFFGCVVIAFSWVIARIVFKETFATIDMISQPNPKLVIINTLFQKIQKLDYTQKMQVLKGQNKPYTPAIEASNEIIELLDSLKNYCKTDTLKTGKIDRMQQILYERDGLFLNYLKFRHSIEKNNPLSKDIQNLSSYIAQNLKKNDSNIVRTTVKNTVTTTLLNSEVPQKKIEKKESFLKRVFNRKKNVSDLIEPPKQLITENIQETIDTFALTQRDSFMKDMERAVVSIEKDRFVRRNTLMNHELKLASASTIFINELEKLLRQVQIEEIEILQRNTNKLSSVFDTAFNWVELILCGFMILLLVLIYLIFTDISRSHKIKLQLIEAKEKAEHLEQVKQRFLANMSHEIRTPLQSIIGYSEQIKDQEQPDKHSLDAIYRSSEHLLQIVNEVLDYSRIISGKFTFEKHVFEMQDLLAEVADIMEGLANKKNIVFKLRYAAQDESLYTGDPFRLKQILFNLLSNAIKFTDKGMVSIDVTANDVSPKKTEFIFEIKDTGIGMTDRELSRIFNTFEQAGDAIQRQYGGTGLGLSISKKLIQMQGGTIEASSEKNKGSVFKVRISYLKSTQRAQQKELYKTNASFSKSEKIVVVDDDAFILQLCSDILTKHKIPHICYSSSQQLIEAVWDNSITVALIDIRMPGVSGIELFHLLKERVSSETLFIALTAQALPDEKNEILKHGFNRILLKPFREKELIETLYRISVKQETNIGLGMDQLDLQSLKHTFDQEEEVFHKTLLLLVSELQADLKLLSNGIETTNFEKIANSTHRLSSKVGQVGMHQLSFTLHQLELDARKQLPNLYQNYSLSTLANEIEEIINQIKNHSPTGNKK